MEARDVSGLVGRIEEDLVRRFPRMHRARRHNLAELSGVMLTARSANMNELASCLPRAIARAEDRYQHVERVLANRHLAPDAISLSLACDVIAPMVERGETVVLMLDQSHVNDGHEMLMLSVRLRDRALPVAWRVRACEGNIGFAVQRELLDVVRAALPAGARVMLAADRFYGTPALVTWCADAGWDWRIRLKGNLTLRHAGGEMRADEVATLAPAGLQDAELCIPGARTNVGVLHERGHREPWIIAMSAVPARHTVLDYSLRWGIEAMFSDFKSRGFGLAQSHITKPDRLERLVLVMAIAMTWAVSCGLHEEQQTQPTPKKSPRQVPPIPVLLLQARPALPSTVSWLPMLNSTILLEFELVRGGKMSAP